jgi:TP901 family phage tail tape measure protein
MSINVGDGIVRLIGDPTDVDRKLAQMGRKGAKAGKQVATGLKPVSGSLANIKKLALGVGAVFGAWQVIRVLKNAAKAAIEFGKEFANVATLINTETPKGVKQLQILKQQILALRPELGSARDLTEGLYQALSAGAEPAGAVKLVGEAALFAKAALTDTLTAVDLMTTVINAYGLSVKDAAAVSSTLFKTIELGKITGQELAGALGRVIPVAATLNVSLPELNAMLATLTKSGLSTAEAVTSVRAILKTLISPESAKRFEKLGISQAKMRDIIAKDGLNAALQELDKRLKGDTAATAELFREQEAQVGIFTLLGAGAEEYKQNVVKLTKAQKDATATSIAAEKQFATLSSRLETIGIMMQKEFIAVFENMIPVFKVVLTSFGDTGASGKILGAVLAGLGLGFTLIVGAVQGVVLAIQFLLKGFSEIVRLGAVLAQKIPFLGDTVFGELAKQVEQVAEGFSVQLDAAMKGSIKSLGQLVDAWRPANEIMAQAEEQAEKTAAALDKIDKVAGRVGPSFDLAAAGVARFRGENAALMEEYHRLQIQQTLDDLNNSLEILGINLEELPQTAEEALGQFGEIAEAAVPRAATAFENLRDIGKQSLEDLTGAFQQAVQAWILGGGSIGEAMKRAAAGVLAGVAAQAAVLAIFELAKGFAALFFNPAEAASHFKAAALFGATAVAAGAAAKAIAPPGRVATISGRRGEPRGVITAGREEEEAGPLIVERRMAMGGLITRPTLAMLGERGPELVVPVGRPARAAGGEELGLGPTTIVQHFHIEGMISPDVLDDVIEQISDRVRNNNGGLLASDSLNFTPKT